VKRRKGHRESDSLSDYQHHLRGGGGGGGTVTTQLRVKPPEHQ